jgi:hypothetical protein
VLAARTPSGRGLFGAEQKLPKRDPMTIKTPKNGQRVRHKPAFRQQASRSGRTTQPTGKEKMTYDELLQMGAAAVGRCNALEQDATIQFYRAGEFLTLAKAKSGKREWGRLLEEYQIARTSDWEARELFRLAESEAALVGMSKAEALRRFKIRAPKDSEESAVNETRAESVQQGNHRMLDEAEEQIDDDESLGIVECDTADDPVDTDGQENPTESKLETDDEQVNDEQEEDEFLLGKMGEVIDLLAIVEKSVKSVDIQHELRPRFLEQIQRARIQLFRIGKAISPVPAQADS